MGNEHALLISNHRSDIDWLVGWVLSQRSGCLGSTVAMMKKVLKYLPVIGWSMWFSEYVFPERSWAKDESTLKLALFVEGTRFTQGKLSAAQQYAISSGLPIPRHVLLPRIKDAFLENYFASGRFGTEEIQDIRLPKKSLIVMIVWSCLLVLGAVEFLSWTSLFSTREGIALSAAFLLLVVILMQVLTLFSQSEPSAPVDNIQEDPVREHLLKQ
ncbi:hypothetical protein Nepgr_014579 [Nepenthes gracilis]|uniref:Phospholipid/glycerol acyltransferase domain-containing protein n=1 Tax=Nepenthes gracilis TaxID=150966 RepID=A0AAD3SJS1_NEPGR|nr:hypothetical protein Nepgr_014579 [Nepenthes gracilis]